MRVNHVRVEVIRCAMNYLEWNKSWNVRVMEDYNIFDKTSVIKWGINWSCLGTCSVDKTDEFASQLLKCTQLAETLNQMNITTTFTGFDKLVTNKEDLDMFARQMAEHIIDENYFVIEAFLTAVDLEHYNSLIF